MNEKMLSLHKAIIKAAAELDAGMENSEVSVGDFHIRITPKNGEILSLSVFHKENDDSVCSVPLGDIFESSYLCLGRAVLEKLVEFIEDQEREFCETIDSAFDELIKDIKRMKQDADGSNYEELLEDIKNTVDSTTKDLKEKGEEYLNPLHDLREAKESLESLLSEFKIPTQETGSYFP